MSKVQRMKYPEGYDYRKMLILLGYIWPEIEIGTTSAILAPTNCETIQFPDNSVVKIEKHIINNQWMFTGGYQKEQDRLVMKELTHLTLSK